MYTLDKNWNLVTDLTVTMSSARGVRCGLQVSTGGQRWQGGGFRESGGLQVSTKKQVSQVGRR